ncbi:hypothetical protein E1I69_11030 [Bacillus timonensis]|uniref:Uncharacterized protein n=1 Tax=Bacillus timonensis TaxID=1033734 RepID=A0A4S3PS33_9BACI|nr:hypothetical protein [Bacillus timonensis]THE12520.1 hypothetical protein E1I69_11030 [Bacillus timonensis]
MEPHEIRRMRMNQILLTNGTMLTVLILFFTIINVFTIRFPHFFFTLAVLILIQAIFGFIKRDSTKSFLPILEKVATYEKQKMGDEWSKIRKVSSGWSLVLSAFMFFQFYMSLDYEYGIFQIDPIIMLIVIIMAIVVTNIGMLIHFRKVDRSTSESDMKGYTWKSNLIAGVVGLVFGLAIFMMTIYYVISNI